MRCRYFLVFKFVDHPDTARNEGTFDRGILFIIFSPLLLACIKHAAFSGLERNVNQDKRHQRRVK